VDWEALAETVAASVVAGVGIAIAFSLAIYGATRVAEARRVRASLATVAAAALTVVALGTCLAAIAGGILAMTSG
jgi:hypothetical protein